MCYSARATFYIYHTNSNSTMLLSKLLKLSIILIMIISFILLSQNILAKTQGKIKTYYVEKGETLGSIAKKFSTTYESIIIVNDLANPNKIDVGQKLVVPSWDINDVTKLDRIYFAEIYERGLKVRWHNTKVIAEGQEGTTLRITWSLIDQSVADDIMDNDTKANIKSWGFNKVIFGNERGQTYDYKLINITREEIRKLSKKSISKKKRKSHGFSSDEYNRIKLAKQMDDEMGSDVTITAEGIGHKTLRYETLVMDKNFAHLIYQQVDETRTLARAGFDGLICSDGNNFQVFWKLF